MTEQVGDFLGILARYADGPQRLEAALAGLAEADLDVALSADSWTIRQLVHHVVDGDDLWNLAIKAALGESRGLFTFQWYWEREQDRWAEAWRYATRAIEPALTLFRANRHHLVQLLQQIPDAGERTALITLPDNEAKSTPVWYVVMMQADHVEAHLQDIAQIREKHQL